MNPTIRWTSDLTVGRPQSDSLAVLSQTATNRPLDLLNRVHPTETQKSSAAQDQPIAQPRCAPHP